MLDADSAERLAARVLEERYPDADAAFATGSIVRGEATSHSDLDLVVLFEHLPNARREAFLVDGFRLMSSCMTARPSLTPSTAILAQESRAT